MATPDDNDDSIPPATTTTTPPIKHHYRVNNYPTHTPIAYYAVISLFRFVLAIFFNRIVIENPDLVPTNGRPTILLANHSNSLTDALVVMAAVPRHARRMLRMTAKATHFRRGTFSSWLIEKAGSVPLMRLQDYGPGALVDNSAARGMLVDALCSAGDAICIFPEGISRYHPALAPLKTGAARIAAEVLEEAVARGQEGFELNISTCSITYLHRQNFRSDVLVSFHPPTVLSPTPASALLATDPAARRQAVVDLTAALSEQLRAGTLDAPSWHHIRAANMARTLYAPFGTRLGLGPHVRLTQKFIDALGHPDASQELFSSLLAYQNELVRLGIKDDRVANNTLTSRRTILKRLALRLVAAAFLASICLPGLALWLPIFGTTWYFANKQRRKGPAWDTYDEVTQTKMLWGLASGLVTYLATLVATLPILPISMVAVPLLMWFTLRWLEDLVATLRAARSLYRMLTVQKPLLNKLRTTRSSLHQEVMALASSDLCNLPNDSQRLLEVNQELVIKNGKVCWDRIGYFDVRRRRKKDYNEVLRLWEVVDM